MDIRLECCKMIGAGLATFNSSNLFLSVIKNKKKEYIFNIKTDLFQYAIFGLFDLAVIPDVMKAIMLTFILYFVILYGLLFLIKKLPIPVQRTMFLGFIFCNIVSALFTLLFEILSSEDNSFVELMQHNYTTLFVFSLITYVTLSSKINMLLTHICCFLVARIRVYDHLFFSFLFYPTTILVASAFIFFLAVILDNKLIVFLDSLLCSYLLFLIRLPFFSRFN